MNQFMQNIYISNTDPDEAVKIFFMKCKDYSVGNEKISVIDSLGRITSECIYAEISSPYCNSSAMDGIAVRAESTFKASEASPKILAEDKDFIYINTGNPLPEQFDAVIMIEDVIELGDKKVRIISPAHSWQHIRAVGEDISAGEMIIQSRHKIRPVDIGALLSAGIKNIMVYNKPRVGILPTGSELIEDPDAIEAGKIIESNSRVFEGLIKEYGGIPKRYSPCPDNFESMKQAVLKAADENDILIINAGSSAGRKDYVHRVLKELGKIIIHGIALKPGKPTILCKLKGKPVIGIPGYPVSSYIVFEAFAKPLILDYSKADRGQMLYSDTSIKAVLSRRIVSSFKNREIIRAAIGYIDGRYIATPLMRGAGATMSLVRADGLFMIPQNSEGLEAGEEVEVKLIKPLENIKNTLVSIGSHDIIMDEIADMTPLSSAHTGSMGGITAMRRKECHIAPIHLLDADTGEYNLPFIRKYFKGSKMVLIKGLKRMQGFIVQTGNPKNITGLKSLTGKNIRFVNRQKGSGTRILLDYNLKNNGLNPNDIEGYDNELTTHMAVAAFIKSGAADAGPGVLSAAKVSGLDFIPLGYEEYDFLTTPENLDDERLKRLISVLKSKELKKRAERIGGYEMSSAGDTIYA